MEETDSELVARARQGDRDAMEALVVRYQRRLVSVAVGMLKNPDDAAEVVQETFIRIFRNLDGFKGDSSFYTWAYRIAVNLAIDFQRRESKRTAVEFDEAAPPTSSESLPSGALQIGRDPFVQTRNRELGRRIFDAIENLTPDHRAVILLREIDGQSYEEIAESLQISIGTVMSRLHYARKNLQKHLSELV